MAVVRAKSLPETLNKKYLKEAILAYRKTNENTQEIEL